MCVFVCVIRTRSWWRWILPKKYWRCGSGFWPQCARDTPQPELGWPVRKTQHLLPEGQINLGSNYSSAPWQSKGVYPHCWEKLSSSVTNSIIRSGIFVDFCSRWMLYLTFAGNFFLSASTDLMYHFVILLQSFFFMGLVKMCESVSVWWDASFG